MYSDEEIETHLSSRMNEGMGRRKLMHEYDEIEDELYKTFKKKRQSSKIRESDLFNPPPPTSHVNSSEDHFDRRLNQGQVAKAQIEKTNASRSAYSSKHDTNLPHASKSENQLQDDLLDIVQAKTCQTSEEIDSRLLILF